MSPAEAEQERLRKMLQTTPEAYVDKVMVPGDAPLSGGGPGDPDADAGDFRSWFSESRFVTSRASGDGVQLRPSHELGQRFGYRRETLNHGDYELLADVRATNGGVALGPGAFTSRRASARITGRNVGFPVTTRMFADTSAGDIFSELTDALTRNYRLSLGTRPVRGLGTRVYTPEFELRAGTGQRGDLTGGPFAGFEPTGGSMSWLGGTRRTRFGTLGLQFNRATAAPGALVGSSGQDTVDSVAAAYRFKGDLAPGLGFAARMTAIRSTTSSPAPEHREGAAGWFAEGTLVTDNTRQEFGLFDADPQLRFGEGRIFDNRGAYWRVDRQRGGLGWGLGVQVDQQVAQGLAAGSRRLGLQGNVQLQLDRRHAIGGSFSIDDRRLQPRGADEESSRLRAYYGTAYYQMLVPRIGRTRLLATLRRNQVLVANGSTATGEEFAWEQDWLLGRSLADPSDFSTTLGLAHDRQDAVATWTPTAGVRLSFSPALRWSVSANLRYTSSRSNLSVTQGLSGFFDTEYDLANGWRVGASLNLNQVAVQLADTPLIPTAGSSQLLRTRDAYLSLWARYDGSRGATERGIGVSEGPSVGAGALAGRVFFDENRDGTQQPQEAGVPGVEVILDARFRTVTDNAGRFAFPLVTTGVHRIGVREESVPLPWGAAEPKAWRTEVPLRGEGRVAVPVVKVGE